MEKRTFCRTIEANVELLHVVVDKRDFVVRHHPTEEESGIGKPWGAGAWLWTEKHTFS